MLPEAYRGRGGWSTSVASVVDAGNRPSYNPVRGAGNERLENRMRVRDIRMAKD